MHELSVALAIVDLASEEAAKLGAVQVTAVRINLGALAGVVKDALLFSFETAIAGTRLEGARLHIDDVPVTVWCSLCEAERELANGTVRRCPVCDSVSSRLVRGTEMQLTALEIRDA